MNPNPPNKRRGVMTLRTLGRAFWIGLAASLALHAFLIVKGRFQMPRWEDDVPVLEARLEAEENAAPPPEPRVAGKPAPTPQPQAQQDSSPPEALPIAAVAQSEPAAEPAPALAPPEPEPVLPLSSVEPPPQSAQPYSALTQAAESIRQLPAHIEIVYELNGMLSGRQTHVWQLTEHGYTLETEGEVTGLAGLFVSGKMIQKSTGRIGPLGLMPERYEMQRLSGKQEALRFDYAANVIESSRTDSRRGTRTRELPLLTGAQDPLSSIYQLAMAAQDGKNGFIVAAGSKRVKGYPYRTLGKETLATPLGELQTLHVAQAGDSDKGAVHLWLAPARHFLPVKVTYVDEDGTNWELEAVSITTRSR
jgi:hypothetical protein